MKQATGKTAALLFTVLLIFSLMISVHAADNDGYIFDDLGKKAAQPLVTPGRYEVTVSVPGAVETEEYSEIIVMVDASSSQGANLQKLKAMLVRLAEDVLHDDGSMRLTLMGFGMGPARGGSFYNAETLEEFLIGVTQADLRQRRRILHRDLGEGIPGLSWRHCDEQLPVHHSRHEEGGLLSGLV